MSRPERVADFIRDELASIIQREVRDPRVGVMVSVSDVEVSRDLAFADVYVSSFDANDDAARQALVDVLSGASGFLRTTLAKRHKMRTTPKLRFHYDTSLTRGPQLESLIQQAVAADETDGADEAMMDELGHETAADPQAGPKQVGRRVDPDPVDTSG